MGDSYQRQQAKRQSNVVALQPVVESPRCYCRQARCASEVASAIVSHVRWDPMGIQPVPCVEDSTRRTPLLLPLHHTSSLSPASHQLIVDNSTTLTEPIWKISKDLARYLCEISSFFSSRCRSTFHQSKQNIRESRLWVLQRSLACQRSGMVFGSMERRWSPSRRDRSTSRTQPMAPWLRESRVWKLFYHKMFDVC